MPFEESRIYYPPKGEKKGGTGSVRHTLHPKWSDGDTGIRLKARNN